MTERADVPAAIVDHLRRCCLALPDAYEEAAWVGTRWMVLKKTFAHVLMIADAWPPAYVRAAGSEGPLTVLMFRSAGVELAALRNAGPPFFSPPWRADEVGMTLDDNVDWNELSELVTESYCVQAPKALVELVDRPE